MPCKISLPENRRIVRRALPAATIGASGGASSGARRGDQLEDPLAPGPAADLDRVELAKFESAHCPPLSLLADEDARTEHLVGVFEARRQIDPVADYRVVARLARPDAAGDDLAGGDAAAHLDALDVDRQFQLVAHLAAEFGQRAPLLERRVAGLDRGVAGAGEGRPPERHDRIADI